MLGTGFGRIMTGDKRGGTHKAGMEQGRNKGSQSDKRRSAGGDIGGTKDSVAHSLRQAYQQTIAEEVPDEMLELLKKLG